MARAFIGTSGFSYSHWQGVFYPQGLKQKDELRYYSEHFDTVEINATFYHQMKPQTFKNWRKIAGPNFVFAIKGSRFITHIKKLKDCQEPLERLMEGVEALRSGIKTAEVGHASLRKQKLAVLKKPRLNFCGPQLSRDKTQGDHNLSGADSEATSTFLPKAKTSGSEGDASNFMGSPRSFLDVVLFQLPPHWQVNPVRLKGFVEILPRDFRFAFEFRDESWLCPQIYEILKKANSALVIQDSPYWSTEEEITANFVYLRFHGSKRLYSSCYTKEELKNWAKKIKNWLRMGLDVYCYFNNDALGYAVENAKTLKSLIS